MPNPAEFVKLAEDHARAAQALRRTPEPDSVTTAEGSVREYAEMMGSNMTANYAVSLDLIARTRDPDRTDRALDLCCGPGHFSFCLSQYLGYGAITGVDLSSPMIEIAARKARSFPYPVAFHCGDAREAPAAEGGYDLVSITNSAHHFPDLGSLTALLTRAEQLASPHGLIFLSDLARLKTEELTQKFVGLAGARYGNSMRQDFLHSMRAAWLPDELVQAVPIGTKRAWYSVVLGGLPFLQALIGLPSGRTELFVSGGVDWAAAGLFPDEETRQEWGFLSACLAQAKARVVPTLPAEVARKKAG